MTNYDYLSGEIAETTEQKLAIFKARVKTLLEQTDYTQLADVPLTEEKKQEFVLYRQQLRTLINNTTDPDSVIFPEIPN